MLTQDELKTYFNYNPDTGIFICIAKKHKSKYIINQPVGCIHDGYLCIEISNKSYRLHRLAWLYMCGCFPKNQIDHINMIRNDNRWCNLREATNSQNKMNNKLRPDNKTGFKGVSIHKRTGQFKAQARLNKAVHYLGLFDTAEKASEAYLKFAKIHYGEFFSLK